jgi:hypothetical protein
MRVEEAGAWRGELRRLVYHGMRVEVLASGFVNLYFGVI